MYDINKDIKIVVQTQVATSEEYEITSMLAFWQAFQKLQTEKLRIKNCDRQDKRNAALYIYIDGEIEVQGIDTN